jgi:hypothetical protein
MKRRRPGTSETTPPTKGTLVSDKPILPEGDADRDRGLYAKYRVEKINGKPVGERFVLEAHDQHAIAALRAYAESCADEFISLATDLALMADRWASEQASA